MKKIVAISSVKNESDIIESFCRYTLSFADAMLIYENHKSSDNTRGIIQKLIDEGLPICFEAETDMYYETAKGELAKEAVRRYKADLVLQLDADEFLCHVDRSGQIDGISPRETLENLKEDTEYQVQWRTYVYQREPEDINAFVPDGFDSYRNPAFEEAQGHAGKTIASRYLLETKGAVFVHGAHWLDYPEKHKKTAKVETSKDLVCAHYPIRSRAQVMIKVIPNWINKWTLPEEKRVPRETLSEFQLGIIFDDIKKYGDASRDIMKQASIVYSLFTIGDREKINELLSASEEEQICKGKIDAAFCRDKLALKYTDSNSSNEAFIQAALQILDNALQALDSESRSKTHAVHELEQHHTLLKETIDQNNALLRHISDLTGLIHNMEQQQKTALGNMGAEIAAIRHIADSRAAYIGQLEHMLREHKNAFWWRATKPMRVITGGMKKLIKGGRAVSGEDSDGSTENAAGSAPDGSENIKFSIIVSVYNTDEKFLREMIQSVLAQSCQNWELCIVNASDGQHEYTDKICREHAKADKRIKYKRLEINKGISANTNEALIMAAGDYIVLLDHDDTITEDALSENAAAITETGALVLYSDEDHISPEGELRFPFYKPDWSPDLLYCQNYICHMLVFDRRLLKYTGEFNPDYDGAQDYDLILRLSELTNRICHIPKVLYHWRDSSASTSMNPESKPYAQNAGLNALNAHLDRMHTNRYAKAEESEITYVYDVRYNTLAESPLVSIIIPMKDKRELTDNCISSILEKTGYTNYEIIIINNRSREPETKDWLGSITQKDTRIRVIDADIDFNWSRLNNLGISEARGEVYVLLNNDTLVISPDWLERLAENALRENIGIVSPLLLYEDGTIQHAGVVVGMGGYADHIFKAGQPEHWGTPYCSPMVSRNVLAVTGACYAVSKYTIGKIGLFDERFEICGSDVELCIRAYRAGLNNLYVAFARLCHLESKSRDDHIPEIDHRMSEHVYAPYLRNGDPYFNRNLSLQSTAPAPAQEPSDFDIFGNYRLRTKHGRKPLDLVPVPGLAPGAAGSPCMPVGVAEVTPPFSARKSGTSNNTLRINIIIPSVNRNDVYGGIATALDFFFELVKISKARARIIVINSPVDTQNSVVSSDYALIDSIDLDIYDKQLVNYCDREGKTIPVCAGDVFIATAWWTAYCISPVIQWQNKEFGGTESKLIYFIQDYEPGFYPWSARYLLAESTYMGKDGCGKIAVFNSENLYDYFMRNNYSFEHCFFFEPTLNKVLLAYLNRNRERAKKKKRVIIYGRPVTHRNAFELIVLSLRKWCLGRDDIDGWEILSLGEQHESVMLENGKVLHSLGKVSLEEYAEIMLETYMAVSLMVSPHPSYPPLEMAAFGIKVITNRFANKDLSPLSSNIISLDCCDEDTISGKLEELASGYTKTPEYDMPEGFAAGKDDTYTGICEDILKVLKY